MRVFNHTDFTMNNQIYNSFGVVKEFPLGTIVSFKEDGVVKIGVVIQHLNENGEIRTDMSGIICIDNIKEATLDEVKMYRKELIPFIVPTEFVVNTTKKKWKILESYISFDEYIKNNKPHKEGERDRFNLPLLIFNIGKFDKDNFFRFVEDFKISELFGY